MSDPNPGERLLQTACELLRRELLPALPAHRRHAALMVARAMDIAARELDRGRDRARADEIDTRNRRWRSCIREGGADQGAEAVQLHAQLLADARARVETDNPKFLEKRPTP